MTNVDQFESAFRSAAKEVFSFEPVGLGSILIVTDLERGDAVLYEQQIRAFLSVLEAPDQPQPPAWRTVPGSEYRTVRDMLDLVEEAKPDLICAYRHLHSEGWRWPFTLGDHVEVLTQATSTPVLVLPHPQAQRAAEHAIENTNVVMAMTDHLTGDRRLVNYAARFTEPGGRLLLSHVEDDATFERYIEAISKITTIDTDHAREAIHEQLLKEPGDYVESCRTGLAERRPDLTVEPLVVMGRRLSEYERIITEHEIDLLVMNTKDEDQLAMHGLAYPLAVELRSIPLLMM